MTLEETKYVHTAIASAITAHAKGEISDRDFQILERTYEAALIHNDPNAVKMVFDAKRSAEIHHLNRMFEL